MSRIATIFSRLRDQQRKALMPFICGEHPSSGMTGPVLAAVAGAGAAIIEVGIPFSDPIADGPVIAQAMHEAIARGASPASVFAEVAKVRATIDAGLVAMISMSLVHRFGSAAAFAAAAKEAGFDGIIVPDAPIQESGALVAAARESGLAYAHLIAPTTPPKRIEQIVAMCSGFVYVLARTGITGQSGTAAASGGKDAGEQAPPIGELVGRVRACTDLPIAVGFGISTPEQVAAVVRYADAAIVGSALVQVISSAAREGRDVCAEAAGFVSKLSTALPGQGG